jgi:signal transduction histidine kinase
MDDQSKANFFRPFFSNYRQFGGTGIGTMIMQRALALHNGHITLESEPGVGTTIFFHLPRSVYAG